MRLFRRRVPIYLTEQEQRDRDQIDRLAEQIAELANDLRKRTRALAKEIQEDGRGKR